MRWMSVNVVMNGADPWASLVTMGNSVRRNEALGLSSRSEVVSDMVVQVEGTTEGC